MEEMEQRATNKASKSPIWECKELLSGNDPESCWSVTLEKTSWRDEDVGMMSWKKDRLLLPELVTPIQLRLEKQH
ncbi:hypothetical protein EK904_013420 [Melospiza melodia maxima]|nr:hypothetical protein EK904_013420 [Melospiza melodia maxima]